MCFFLSNRKIIQFMWIGKQKKEEKKQQQHQWITSKRKLWIYCWLSLAITGPLMLLFCIDCVLSQIHYETKTHTHTHMCLHTRRYIHNRYKNIKFMHNLPLKIYQDETIQITREEKKEKKKLLHQFSYPGHGMLHFSISIFSSDPKTRKTKLNRNPMKSWETK